MWREDLIGYPIEDWINYSIGPLHLNSTTDCYVFDTKMRKRVQLAEICHSLNAHLFQDVLDLKWIWKTDFTPKIKLLLWRLGSNSLPSGSRVQAVLDKDTVPCPRCGQEDLDHVFRKCELIRNMWNHIRVCDDEWWNMPFWYWVKANATNKTRVISTYMGVAVLIYFVGCLA